MPNQRSKTKKVISVPLPRAVLDAIEDEAERRGIDRVQLINEVLAREVDVDLPVPKKEKQ